MIDDPLLPKAGVVRDVEGEARWTVWAPLASGVELLLDPGEAERRLPMRKIERGFFEAMAACEGPGQRYGYSLDGGPVLPDPTSRWQPKGASGPSAVVFPGDWSWKEGAWNGRAMPDLVFYELHVGTFTAEGTFDAIIPRIRALRELGITAIELMPVAQGPGVRGWGYDGVLLFAPQHSYGGPEGLKRLIEACHCEDMAIFLDVVHNHLGPEGNVLPRFGPYFNDRYRTDWGPAVNFDASGCDPVRAFVLDNVRMWVRDYRFDGLRLDAADQIYDRSPSHILREVAEVAHAEGEKRGRPCHVFAETDQNDAGRYLHDPARGGFGLDGHWNDDFHHACHVVLTGDATGYFADFADGPASLAKVYERIFVNNGCYSPFRDRRHGAPAGDLTGERFVAFVQNHDQIANGNAGKRDAAVLSSAATRLAAGLLLLAPRLPLLFMGEEYGETNDFPYFCDFASPELKEAVRQGRAAEFAYFGRTEAPADPLAATTRDAAVLSWSWDEPRRTGMRRLYGELLRMRRERPGLQDFEPPRVSWEGEDREVLQVKRGDLTILFNLGASERPLSTDREWTLRSEVPEFGAEGQGEPLPNCLRPFEFVVG